MRRQTTEDAGMTDIADAGQGAGRRARGGGGAARRAERTAVSVETARFIERNIPNFEVLNEEALQIIEHNAETVLEETGVKFVENPGALRLWRDAGADVRDEHVRIPRGLARKLCSTAPRSFTQHARNPERNVEVGGSNLVLAPVYGPPFVRTAEGGRRYATIEDFRNFVKLGYMSKWLHHSGGTVCEPTDVAVNKRHLDMLHAHMTLSDKPFMGSVTAPERAQDSVDMASLLFGADFVQQNTVMTSLININSPLDFDGIMMGALEVYARNNQAAIISPFIVGGAMAPCRVAGTLTQVLAEILTGVAYSQLVRPGAPVIAGGLRDLHRHELGRARPSARPRPATSPMARVSSSAVWGCPTGARGLSAAPSCPTRRRPMNPPTASTWGCSRASTSCSIPAAGWKGALWPPTRSS
jgi:trimethylamine--corrinoid protein Co-methyltransferase